MNGPKQPNAGQDAFIQGIMNQQAAQQQQRMNMINQNNPLGGVRYNADPNSPGGYSADTYLSAPAQGIFDSTMGAKQGMATAANTLANSGAGALSGNPLDLSWGATEGQLSKLNHNTLDPQFAQSQAALESKLASQGIMPGSEGYSAQMRTFNDNKNRAYDQAALTGHQTAVNDLTNQYNSPVNALSALLSGSSIQNPNSQFVATPQESIQAPNFMGADQQQYQNALSQNNAAMGGLFGLGGNLAGILGKGLGGIGAFGALL